VAQVRELEHPIDEALVVLWGMMWPAEHENMIVYRNIRQKWDVHGYQANEAELEKTDCFVRRRDEQAFDFFGRRQHTEKKPTTEIDGMQTKDMNEVEMRKQGLLARMHKN
jgi:hypothetical protein